MNNSNQFAFILTLVLAVACGRETPEQRLEDAASDVRDVEEDIAELGDEIGDTRQMLESRRQVVRETEAKLAKVRNEIRKLQNKLSEEQAELDSMATDTAIFRFVQRQLLDDPQLADIAISVTVLDGEVVLFGDSATAAEKSRAGELAAEAPGVTSVTNLIVADKPAKAEGDPESESVEDQDSDKPAQQP